MTKHLIVPCAMLVCSLAWAADPIQLKNGREIFAGYASAMNVDDNDRDLRELFRLNADRFPKGGKPEELSNTVIMASTEVGGAFCKKALTREAALPVGQRTLFADVNFNRGPSQISGYVLEKMVNRMANLFWLRDATPAERQSLGNTVATATIDKSDSTDELKRVLQITCTTFASSLAFLTK